MTHQMDWGVLMTPDDLLVTATTLVEECHQGIHLGSERSSMRKEIVFLRRVWDSVLARGHFPQGTVFGQVTRLFFVAWSVASQRHGPLKGRVNVCVPQDQVCSELVHAYTDFIQQYSIVHPAGFVAAAERDTWGMKGVAGPEMNPALLLLEGVEEVMCSYADMAAFVTCLNRQNYAKNGCLLFSKRAVDTFNPVVKDGRHYDYTMLKATVLDIPGIVKEVANART